MKVIAEEKEALRYINEIVTGIFNSRGWEGLSKTKKSVDWLAGRLSDIQYLAQYFSAGEVE